MKMNSLDWVMMTLLLVGGLNWGLVGIFKFDLVAAIVGKTFGEVTTISQIIYALVGLSAIYMLYRSMKKPGTTVTPAAPSSMSQ